MARVPYRTVDEIDPENRELLARPVHLYQALINSPDACRTFQGFADWVRWKCELDPRLREMLILYIGYVLESEYEWSHHVIISRQFGVSDDDIEQIICYATGRPSSLSRREEIALRAGKEISLNREISDGTWEELRLCFDEAQSVELIVVASFYNMVVRVLSALRIDLEPEWSEPLTRFPLTPRTDGVD